jgi:hypothetical protein
MTQYTYAHLDMADRHIAEAERHIVRQEHLLLRLQVRGLPTAEAEAMLDLMHATLVQHRTHRAAIEAALEASRG